MLQIIGNRKSRDTARAERFAKERRIPYQFVDITKRSLSEKEWRSILGSADDLYLLVDTESSFYRKNGYAWREYDPAEELIMHPELLVMPVLRAGGRVHPGFSPEFIEENR